MEIKRKEVDVFIVNGKEFFSKEEAKRYEESLQKRLSYTYYRVTHNPDLTEGRGYYDMMIVAVGHGYVRNALYQYLIDTLGKPVEMVMGVSPIDNWIVSEPYKFDDIKELEAFLNKEFSVGIGSYKNRRKLKVVYLNDSGKIMI